MPEVQFPRISARPLIFLLGILTFLRFMYPVRPTAPKRLPLWERIYECSHYSCLASLHTSAYFPGSESSVFPRTPNTGSPESEKTSSRQLVNKGPDPLITRSDLLALDNVA
jgi:hypothetical protein